MTAEVKPAKYGVFLGLIFGGILILEFLVFYYIGIKTLTSKQGLIFKSIVDILNLTFIPILLIYLACSPYKKYNLDTFSVRGCLKIGVSIALIASLLYALFFSAFVTFVPSYVEELVVFAKETAYSKTPKISAEEIKKVSEAVRISLKPTFIIPITIAIYTFTGLMYSLLVGVFLKRK